jgi:hypothetical protein
MRTMTRGRWALAVLPMALAVGCSTSSGPGSVAGDEGVIRSQQATPTAAPTHTERDLLYDWGHGGGLAQIQAISTALGAIHDAGTSADPLSIQGACEKLTAVVTSAKAYPPIPVPSIQAHWAAALTDFNQSALDCAAGVAGLDAATIEKGTAESNEGTAELETATSQVNALQ